MRALSNYRESTAFSNTGMLVLNYAISSISAYSLCPLIHRMPPRSNQRCIESPWTQRNRKPLELSESRTTEGARQCWGRETERIEIAKHAYSQLSVLLTRNPRQI